MDHEQEVYEYEPEPEVPHGSGSAPERSAPSPGCVELADIVEHSLNARESFETFMGRKYDPAERAYDVDAVLQQTALLPSDAQFDVLARHLTATLEAGLEARRNPVAPHRRLESPLQRYTRLVAEVASLQSELRAVEAGDAKRVAGTTAVNHAGGVFKLLDSGAAVVQLQLEKLAGQAQSAASAAPSLLLSADAVSPAARATAGDAVRIVRDQLAAVRAVQGQLAEAHASVNAALAAMESQLSQLVGDR